MSFEHIKIAAGFRKYFVNLDGLRYDVSELLFDLEKTKKNECNHPYFRHLNSVILQRILIDWHVLDTKSSFLSFSLIPGEKFEEFAAYLRSEINKEITKANGVNHSIILITKDCSALISVANELHKHGLTLELSHQIAVDLAETGMGVCPVANIKQVSQMIENLKEWNVECNGHVYCETK